MSRLGRGGGGVGSRMRGQPLPFDIDPELVEAADRSFEDDEEDSGKELFPEFGEFIMSAPITDAERREVQIYRELEAKRRAGPFWTGTREDWAQIDAMSGKSGESHDPFENAQTYGKKHTKKSFKLPDLKKVKLDPRFFPKELWSTIGYSKEGDEDEDEALEGRPPKRQKTLGLAKKSALDRLAKFDEDFEDETNADADEEEGGVEEEEEGEEFEGEPEDDNYDEDDDDANNDYNAEAYFDGGEEDFEEAGGDEYGEDGY